MMVICVFVSKFFEDRDYFIYSYSFFSIWRNSLKRKKRKQIF